jgi:hypothetical protein
MSSGSANISSSPFQWWTSGDFEMCFQYLVFMTASAALFGLLSTYYAGRYNTRYVRVKRPLVVVVRLLLAVCIAVNSVTELGAAFWMNKQRPYAVLTAETVYGVSWVCHAVAMWVFSSSVAYTGRGPLILNSGWYLTLIASILHFRSIIRWTQHHTSYQYITPSDMYFTLLFRVTAYTHMALQTLYGLSLLVAVSEAHNDGTRLHMKKRSRWKRAKVVSIQHGDEYSDEEDDEAREKQPLIHSRFRSEECSSYGALTGSYRDNLNFDLFLMNAYEDHANPLSMLVFWWVWPLLKRGALGYLENISDLPPMPKSLQTSRIREKFRKVLLKKQHASDGMCSSTDQSESGGRSDEGKGSLSAAGSSSRVEYEYYLDSEVMLRSFTRSTPVPFTSCTPDPPSSHQAMGSEQSADSASPPPTSAHRKNTTKSSKPTSLLFLFSALNRAFGLHYYPLGLLKFTTDLLGFAGPLLLYQLVSFIENKKVSIHWPHCNVCFFFLLWTPQ